VFVTPDGETVTDARTLASQLGLLRAMANYDLHRVVTFRSRIRSASAFARSLPEVCAWLPADRRLDGSLWAEHVSGEMASGERDNRLNRLRAVDRAQHGVLTNARCLAEGVDVPTLDGVAFIEPRRSQVDIVQAVGRAIRKAEDKTQGTVVIPVFVDEDTDADEALESGEDGVRDAPSRCRGINGAEPFCSAHTSPPEPPIRRLHKGSIRRCLFWLSRPAGMATGCNRRAP